MRPYLLDSFAAMKRRITHVFAAGCHSLSASFSNAVSKRKELDDLCVRNTVLSGPGLGIKSITLDCQENILLFSGESKWYSSFVTMQARNAAGANKRKGGDFVVARVQALSASTKTHEVEKNILCEVGKMCVNKNV